MITYYTLTDALHQMVRISILISLCLIGCDMWPEQQLLGVLLGNLMYYAFTHVVWAIMWNFFQCEGLTT
jgi:hypothetical protein